VPQVHEPAGEQAGSAAVAVAEDGSAHHRLVIARIHGHRPDEAAARSFGARLARTHLTGAPGYGSAPPGAPAEGWIAALRLAYAESSHWAPWYADHRVAPYVRIARDRGALDPGQAALLDRLCSRLRDDDGDGGGPDEPAARLHGDLWAGNVVWGPDPDRPGEGTGWLIDPAAHGGHREGDLLALALFGITGLETVLALHRRCRRAGRPLDPGWPARVGLHQVHPLLVHACLFGGGYGAAAVRAARTVL
jgi:fructosamine-3-kinase